MHGLRAKDEIIKTESYLLFICFTAKLAAPSRRWRMREGINMKTENKYEATEEDLTRIAELADVKLLTQDESTSLDEVLLEEDLDCSIEIEKTLLNEMAHAAFATTLDEDSFFIFWCENRERIRDAALMSDEVAEMLLLGFKLAITNGRPFP